MEIREVEFVNFRNYPSLHFEPTPSLNFLHGPNAQGKSNILEGLSLLLSNRSPRTTRIQETVAWGSERAQLAGVVAAGPYERRLSLLIAGNGSQGVRRAACPWAQAISFSWQDAALLSGGPAWRRAYIDTFCSRLTPSHRGLVVQYGRLLRQRARALLGARGKGAEGELAAWDEQLVTVGAELMERRGRGIEALSWEVDTLFPVLSGAPGRAMLRYQAAVPLGENREATGETFRAALRGRRREEISRGQNLVGPHRDELLIALDGVDLRTYGSRGQQRLMALALRLAEAGPVAHQTGTEPVLLLDDLFSEIDREAQGRILDWLEGRQQVFLAANDADALGDRPGARWVVSAGQILPETVYS